MSETTAPREANGAGRILTVDGTPLRVSLRRAMRHQQWRAFFLTAPLLAFLIIAFAFPIGQMLLQSFYNPTFSKVMPHVAQAMKTWDPATSPDGLPGEAIYKIMVGDLKAAKANQTIGRAATRINYDLPASRSLFTSSARHAKDIKGPPYKAALIDINKDWGSPILWQTIKRVSNNYTLDFYLAALDRTYDAKGNIVMQAPDRQIYVTLFIRTLWLSLLITFLCLLLAFPVSYLLATLPLRKSNLLMILVLLPFWTSLLVRTTAWIALLQQQGVINSILVALGIVSNNGRLNMIYNQTGTIIAMTHILLPFMILPLYSVMKTIPLSYVRAAKSLGATPFTAFVKIYLPQTVPGIAAGTLLVFILAIGYYITPALVGGQDGQLISNFIAYHMQTSLNWSLASALGGLLLTGVLILYWLYNKLVGVDNLKFG